MKKKKQSQNAAFRRSDRRLYLRAELFRIVPTGESERALLRSVVIVSC